MSKKTPRIQSLIDHCRGQHLDAHYLGFFECFNRQLFFEAHEVLEELWLADRHGADGNFYKGLIQLAGAFVHLQKDRPGPATALFKLARANLQQYPALHQELDVSAVLAMVEDCLSRIHPPNPAFKGLSAENTPRLGVRGATQVIRADPDK